MIDLGCAHDFGTEWRGTFDTFVINMPTFGCIIVGYLFTHNTVMTS